MEVCSVPQGLDNVDSDTAGVWVCVRCNGVTVACRPPEPASVASDLAQMSPALGPGVRRNSGFLTHEQRAASTRPHAVPS